MEQGPASRAGGGTVARWASKYNRAICQQHHLATNQARTTTPLFFLLFSVIEAAANPADAPGGRAQPVAHLGKAQGTVIDQRLQARIDQLEIGRISGYAACGTNIDATVATQRKAQARRNLHTAEAVDKIAGDDERLETLSDQPGNLLYRLVVDDGEVQRAARQQVTTDNQLVREQAIDRSVEIHPQQTGRSLLITSMPSSGTTWL